MDKILDALKQRYPQFHLPEKFIVFAREQVSNGHVLRRAETGERMLGFLRRNHVEDAAIQKLLTPESKLRLKFDFNALMNLGTDDLYAYLLDHLGFVMDLQQIALDSETPTGFNAHGKLHVSTVTLNALKLLRQRDPIPSTDKKDRELVIGGLLHDMGNLIGRKLHGLFGIYIASQILENYDSDPQVFEHFLGVMEVIVFHEVEFASMQTGFAHLGSSTLALIIADKTDVSFERVSLKSNVPEAVQDLHVLMNLLVANSVIWRDTGKGVFGWRVDFRAKYSQDHLEFFSSLLKRTGRVRYPEAWTELYEEANIEYLFLFQSSLLNTYLSRMYVAMSAVFALFPSVTEFHLVVDDAERGISITRVFTRHLFRQQIATLGKFFGRDAWPSSYLYHALHQEGVV